MQPAKELAGIQETNSLLVPEARLKGTIHSPLRGFKMKTASINPG
jgi:hypothetical protein